MNRRQSALITNYLFKISLPVWSLSDLDPFVNLENSTFELSFSKTDKNINEYSKK